MMRDLRELANRTACIGDVRGRGMMIGVELVSDVETKIPDSGLALSLMQRLRDAGYLILPSGVHGNVIGLSPPFGLTAEQWEGFLAAFEKEIVKGASQG